MLTLWDLSLPDRLRHSLFLCCTHFITAPLKSQYVSREKANVFLSKNLQPGFCSFGEIRQRHIFWIVAIDKAGRLWFNMLNHIKRQWRKICFILKLAESRRAVWADAEEFSNLIPESILWKLWQVMRSGFSRYRDRACWSPMRDSPWRISRVVPRIYRFVPEVIWPQGFFY